LVIKNKGMKEIAGVLKPVNSKYTTKENEIERN
jgi:hypothetical protein